MSQKIDLIGADWLSEKIGDMFDEVVHVSPVDYNEAHRYLPQGVSPRAGYIRYDLFPFLVEIINCFDPASDVREANIKKGVQTGFTTLLESILLYYIGHVKTTQVFYLTADKELAQARMDNNIIPMLVESDMKHLIRSADATNSRKTGETKGMLQWDGGGALIYNGAQNAAKMRQFSMPLLLKDELDGWPQLIGKDGDSDSLTDDRASAYWATRKILRGSTPTEFPSMIDKAFQRGDQRVYRILCKKCNAPQHLKLDWIGTQGGFRWETDGGQLVADSVRYCCKECGHEHYEHDKEKIFSADEGAHWNPTAKPVEEGIRSYHLPSFYSPYGIQPWSKGIGEYLDAWDVEAKQVKDIGKFQVFYNNVLGEAFRNSGDRVSIIQATAHNRECYRSGEIPNKYAKTYSGSPILLVTCQVDVHKRNLAVAVMGWTRDARSYVIEYMRINTRKDDEQDYCDEINSSVWGKLSSMIEETIYTADDGKRYNIAMTFVDAGYANDTVNTFCAQYESNVVPILGRERPAKNQSIREFAEFKTKAGTTGYRILVDHYKDRLAPVLRRQWIEDAGAQGAYHFNAPVDITPKQLKELTVEYKKRKVDDKGHETVVWHRPNGADNELWDLLCYGHAMVEVIAVKICIEHFGAETVDWPAYWDYIENEKIFFTESGTP